MRERLRVEERHVGALAELRARRVGAIADRGEPLGDRARQRVVAIARERQLPGLGDHGEERRRLRPEAVHVGLPGVEAGALPGGIVGEPQAPEEGGLLATPGAAAADRQHADHGARAP